MPNRHASVLTILLLAGTCVAAGPRFYVAPNGKDEAHRGSQRAPWRSIGYALKQIPDRGATILVADGQYAGSQSLSRKFKNAVTVRAARPYGSRFKSAAGDARVFSSYGGANVRFEGFVFSGSGGTRGEYLIHLGAKAHDLEFADCVIHDGFVNDMIKINDGANRIRFEGCVFYNQASGANHFDINTVADITLEGCLFFNDYEGSGRPYTKGSAFICAKNSSNNSPNVTRRITIRRNIFMNYQGKNDQAFVLFGEDYKKFYEAQDVMVENNLFLFTSKTSHIGAFQLKGKLRNITFRANTVSGHPQGGSAYAARMWQEGGLKTDIRFQNNIWSDPHGMSDFTDGEKENFTAGLVLHRNLYWNAGKSIPGDKDSVFRLPKDDPKGIYANPKLADPAGAVLPRFDYSKGRFISGSKTIQEEFERVVKAYGVPDRKVAGVADASAMPKDDILGRPRGSRPNIGAYQHGSGGRSSR